MWFLDIITGMRHRLRRAHRQLDQVSDEIIEECEARWRNAQGEDREGEHDLLGVLVRIREHQGDHNGKCCRCTFYFCRMFNIEILTEFASYDFLEMV
jgi:hypothetical protein